MARPLTNWTFNYLDLQKITGMAPNTIHQHRCRNGFDPENLESVLIWASRHATQAVRERILAYALRPDLPENPGARKRPKRSGGR